jgi:hypothetical protein
LGFGLRAAVGLTDAGTQCPNVGGDQQQVAELLDAARLPAGGTALTDLPPIEEGFASPALCEAIRRFQAVQGLTTDARVDVNGATWQRLLSTAQPMAPPVGGVPLLLVASTFDVIELPTTASGLPSLTYSIKGPVATFEGPGVHIELSVQGPMKVDWGATYPIACALSPLDMGVLQSGIATGSARTIGGAALDALCSRIKVESRAAIGNMFAAVTLQVGLDGAPVLGGSIGDATSFQSVAFDPAARAVIYRATKTVFRTEPVLGGSVTLSGGITLELKVTAAEEQTEASVVAALLAAVVGGVVLLPLAEWVAGSAVGSASGVGAGVRQVLLRLGPAFAL